MKLIALFSVVILLICFSLCQQPTTINVLCREGGIQYLLESNIDAFENLTGIKVNIVALDDTALNEELKSELKKGSPYYDGFFARSGEFYNLILCPNCDQSMVPLIQPITEWIKEDGALQWYDVANFERSVSTVYKEEIYMMPVDADVLHLIYRTDILAHAGFYHPPATWEEYIGVAKTINGMDMNADGIPYFATCTGKKNSSTLNNLHDFFFVYAAPYFQYNGTSQGVFFDPTTMAVMINTTAFIEIMEIYKEISKFGPELEINFFESMDLFMEGRCAMLMSFSDILGVMKDSPVANVSTSALPPGSKRVFNRDTWQMEECTSALCPYMDENGVNRAPYATAGLGGYVSRFTTPEKQKAAYDFLSFISQPAQSSVGVFKGYGQDVFRKSQLDSNLWIAQGYTNATAGPILNTLLTVMSSPNVAIPMPMIHQQEYFDSMKTWIACYMYDDCKLEQMQEGLTNDWSKFLKQLGFKDQHTLYAVALGNPAPVYLQQVTLQETLTIAFITLGAFGLLLSISLMVFVILFRNAKLIRGTQTTFHYGTIIGAMMMFLSIIIFSLQPASNCYCSSALWMVMLGFSLMYGNLIAKMFRIWRLSDLKTVEIRVIKDQHLVPLVGGIVVAYIVPLAVWTALDDPTATQYVINAEEEEYLLVCSTGQVGRIIFIALTSLSCSLLLGGCVFAYLTRNVAGIYNESRPVAVSIYAFSFSAIVLIPMIFTITDPVIIYCTVSSVIFFGTTLTLLALFFFKALRIFKMVRNKQNLNSPWSSHYNSRTSTYHSKSNPSTDNNDIAKQLQDENEKLKAQLSEYKANHN